MKVIATSDLHGILPDIEECDLLLICGDIMPLHIQNNIEASMHWLDQVFLPWCADNAAKKVVFIAGNHDFIFERKKNDIARIMLFWQQEDVYYLDGSNTWYVDGLKIFGTPYCKEFGHWAFMRTPEKLVEKYSNIPENVDILLCHDAPAIEEYGYIHEGPWAGTDAGNLLLAEAIKEKKPKYVFCGHIHSGSHELHEIDEVNIANVSLVNEAYAPVYRPLTINI